VSVLDRILDETRVAVAQRREHAPLGGVAAAGGGGRLRAALAAPGIGVIAEFKRRSPSAGSFGEDPRLETILPAYEQGGAVAASILTEEANFAGSLDDLRRARELSRLPLLRKDFIVDEYQLEEAVLAGADAALLIVAALDDEQLEHLQARAVELGLDALVEVHDEGELRRALAAGAQLVGINNRDLRDFTVDVQRTARLMGQVPDGVLVVSESGIESPAQLSELAGAGVHGVLVGARLMRAADPAAALAELRAYDGI